MIPTNYDPRTSEEKWYQYWMEHRFSIPLLIKRELRIVL